MRRRRRRKQSTHTNELLIKQMLKFEALLKFVLLNSEFGLLYHSLLCPLSPDPHISNSSNKEEAITMLNVDCWGGGLGQESLWCVHQKLQYFLIWLRLKPCPNFHAGSMTGKNRNAKQRALLRCNSEVKPYPSPTHSSQLLLWNTKSLSMKKDQKTPKHPGFLQNLKLQAMNSPQISPKLSSSKQYLWAKIKKNWILNKETATAFQTKTLLNHLKKPPSKGHTKLMSVFGMGCV